VPIAKLGHTQQGWEETIEVIGTRGRIHLSSPNWQGTMPCVVALQLDEENQVRTIYPDPTSQWETQAQAFLESVQTRCQGHADVVDGYKVDEILSCIYESGRRRAPVDVRWRC
jgi:predicted dehydrogenase